MWYLPRNASRVRLREAQKARDNRAEIVRALSVGEISRRDLYKWGLLGLGGLALKNGLSPFAPSAFADDGPTGTPPSPLFGAQKFTQPLPRLNLQRPQPLTRVPNANPLEFGDAFFPVAANERSARRLSYHTDFTNSGGTAFINPISTRGPIEGRPPGEAFAHQRWAEFFPRVGYVMSVAPVGPNTRFHPDLPLQLPNSVWTYGRDNSSQGTMPPFLLQMRYGEPVIARVYNNLPLSRADNNGFGRNEIALNLQNAHNGAESNGAANTHHFPGTFYDYRWSATLARRDKANTQATDFRASGPDDNGGLINVPGDWHEIQSTLWVHDNRFFFTAQNTYKGMLGMVNMYSGRDRGNETLNDGVNLRLPSGSHNSKGWGDVDFDVNLVVSDAAFSGDGQLFFDIFDVDGFLGDVPLVNMAYAPFMEVLPRKYRFRILTAGVSRFFKLVIADPNNNAVQFQLIANDGNLLVNPLSMSVLDQQGPGERYDIVVDFSNYRPGDTLHLVNLLRQTNGHRPSAELSLARALRGNEDDRMVGPIMQFRIVAQVQSVDDPTITLKSTDSDLSQVPAVLTEQIPIVTPARTRVIEWGRSDDGTGGATTQCIPDCPPGVEFPWTVRVNGGPARSLNANRVQLLYANPGDIEHWTFVNRGPSWGPFHVHFEEGVTMDRGSDALPASENLARKDAWRVRPGGSVQFQIQFGEYGGAYAVNSQNMVHQDFASLLRLQILNGFAGSPQAGITPTPNPTPEGVSFTTPDVVPEAS